MMAFPFFCLTKKGRTTPLTYRDDKVKIEIKPGSTGMATIWDKDVLIYPQDSRPLSRETRAIQFDKGDIVGTGGGGKAG